MTGREISGGHDNNAPAGRPFGEIRHSYATRGAKIPPTRLFCTKRLITTSSLGATLTWIDPNPASPKAQFYRAVQR